jgi:hypothetical protein
MWLFSFFITICALSSSAVLALLEEKFVGFNNTDESFEITEATIVADATDFVGIHIALKSLTNDYEAITGTRPTLRNITTNSTKLDASEPIGTGSVIIVGSVDSGLIQRLSSEGVLDVTDVRGKWEVFKTAIIEAPMAGLPKALVIVGSDKRGTIYGIHTLAEQSGQSPYDEVLSKIEVFY